VLTDWLTTSRTLLLIHYMRLVSLRIQFGNRIWNVWSRDIVQSQVWMTDLPTSEWQKSWVVFYKVVRFCEKPWDFRNLQGCLDLLLWIKCIKKSVLYFACQILIVEICLCWTYSSYVLCLILEILEQNSVSWSFHWKLSAMFLQNKWKQELHYLLYMAINTL
jgi:hypothetical protein